MIVSKLKKVEELNKQKEVRIVTLEEENQLLKNELKTLKKIVKEEHLEHYNCILTENDFLRKENDDMKNYLKDYGIIWQGEKQTQGEFKAEAA